MFRRCLSIATFTLIFSAVWAHTNSLWAQPLRPPATPMPDASPAGSTEPGYLGLVADDRQENGRGVRLKEVFPEGPSAVAGLQKDDLITAVDGQAIHSADDMAAILKPLAAGARVTFEIDRQGTAKKLDVVLGRRPSPDQRRYKNFGRLPDAPPADAATTAQSPPGSSTVTSPNEPSRSSHDVSPLAQSPLVGQSPLSQYPRSQYPVAQSQMPQIPPQQPMSADPSNAAPANRQVPPQSSNGPAAWRSNLPPQLSESVHNRKIGISAVPVTEQTQARLRLQSTAGAHVVGRAVHSPAEKANVPLDAVITAVNGQAVNSPNELSAAVSRAANEGKIELSFIYQGQPKKATVELNSAAANTNTPNAGSANGSADSMPGSFTGSMPNTGNAPNQTDAQRINALENRVRELEQKIKTLEDRSLRGA